MAARQIVLGYYADWNPAYTPAMIDFSLLSHITHAFAVVSDNGTLQLPDPRLSRDLCTRARSAGVVPLLAVGGAESDTGLATATSTAAGVASLADALARQVTRDGYGGVDVDWEFPTSRAESGRMNSLVAALRARLPQATITMAFPSQDWNGKWFDRDSLQPHVDFVNVMAYDYHGPWTDHAGYNAPLRPSPADQHTECAGNNVEASIAYWIQRRNWSRDKVLLGIPLYGRGFQVRNWGDHATGTYPRSEVACHDVPGLLRAGWRRQWDSAAVVPYLQNPQGTELISYDDADSVQRKGRAARDAGLAGIFFWELSQDFDGRSNPLVRAARAGLL